MRLEVWVEGRQWINILDLIIDKLQAPPKPYTLHPLPYTLHFTPHTLYMYGTGCGLVQGVGCRSWGVGFRV